MMYRATISAAVVALLHGGCGDNLGASDAGPADASVDGPNLPDLRLNRGRAEIDLAIVEQTFAADACELDPDEACVGAEGLRRLLHFSVETPNIGDADMVLGMPSLENEAFQYSECHDHFHFSGYAAYELLDSTGSSIAVGRKQAFCLLDSNIFDTEDPTVSQTPRYQCSFQGIQRGWADVYHSRLPCQFLDITGLADGDYMLRLELNRERGLEESNYNNNVALLPITIGAPGLSSPTEACPPERAPRDFESENRECGWRSDGVFPCTPGNPVSVGCSQHCGSFSLGDCTGDPMLRVCDATRADGNCSYPAAIGFDNDVCGEACPIAFDSECPASGMIEVFSAPRTQGSAYTCNLELFEG